MTDELATATGYEARIEIAASLDDVFEALATIDGLARWWSRNVTGSTEVGGELLIGFAGHGARLRVDRVECGDDHAAIAWYCRAHTKFPDWENTTIVFTLAEHTEGTTQLTFEHRGLLPTCDCYELCAPGWDHYLASLASHARGDGGNPFGSEGWQNRRR